MTGREKSEVIAAWTASTARLEAFLTGYTAAEKEPWKAALGTLFGHLTAMVASLPVLPGDTPPQMAGRLIAMLAILWEEDQKYKRAADGTLELCDDN